MSKKEEEEDNFIQSVLYPEEKAAPGLPPDSVSIQPTFQFPVQLTFSGPMVTSSPQRAEAVLYLPHESHPTVVRLVAPNPGTVGVGPGAALYPLYRVDRTVAAPGWNSGPRPPVSTGLNNLYFGYARTMLICAAAVHQPSFGPTFDPNSLDARAAKTLNQLTRAISSYVQVQSDATPLGSNTNTGTITGAAIPTTTNVLEFTAAQIARLSQFPSSVVKDAHVSDGVILRSGLPYVQQLRSCGPPGDNHFGDLQIDRLSYLQTLFTLDQTATTGKALWFSPALQVRSDVALPISQILLDNHQGPLSFPTLHASIETSGTIAVTVLVAPPVLTVTCYSMFQNVSASSGVATTYSTSSTVSQALTEAGVQSLDFTFHTQQQWASIQSSQNLNSSSMQPVTWVGSLLHITTSATSLSAGSLTAQNKFTGWVAYSADRRFSMDARVFRLDAIGDGQQVRINGLFNMQATRSSVVSGVATNTNLHLSRPGLMLEGAAAMNTSDRGAVAYAIPAASENYNGKKRRKE